MSVSVVAFAGSRGLSLAHFPLVAGVVSSVVGSGSSVSVGCCNGLDAFVLASLPFPAGSCFAAFGSGGVGSCSASAVSFVSAFANSGRSVSWWAGGGSSVPIRSRLSARTRAVIGSADEKAVLFFSSPRSVGSVLAGRVAVSRGLPVFAFACGFSGFSLPSLGSGCWIQSGLGGAWAGSWVWVSSQGSLF